LGLNLCASNLLTDSLSLTSATTRLWSHSKLLCIKVWSAWFWVFLSGVVQVYLQMFGVTIGLYMGRFVTLIPASYYFHVNSHSQLFVWKYLQNFALKSHNRISIWYWGNWLKSSDFS
jgi:hypothetical protein